MDHDTDQISAGSESDSPRIPRARSVPSPWPFRVAVTIAAIHYLSLIVAVTATISLIIKPSQLGTLILISSLALGVMSWIVGYFKRRRTLCPLCKGTPYLNTGALPHRRATRLPPLNHGTTAILSTLASQKFRCMYCGSYFDLLKPNSRLRHGTQQHDTGRKRRRSNRVDF